MTPTRKPPFMLGLAAVAAIALVATLIWFKKEISVALSSGETVQVHFAENYGVRAYNTQVKVAGVEVGDVTDVEPGNGGAVVTVEVHEQAYERLRSEPSARVRPATLLGGNYYLELVPGGQPGAFSGEIPQRRTTVPVELDKVTRALQPDTLDAARDTVGHLDRTLDTDTRAALRDLLAGAPDTLRPAGKVLASARGTRPATDLPDLVRGLNSTASALTSQQGQLDAILHDLDATSAVLGNRSPELKQALRSLPSTLDSANAGLGRLDTTLGKLERSAEPLRPVARELDGTLKQLDPLLRKARPFVSDLEVALEDARPLVEDLVPTARGGTRVLNDVKGPVLKRVNGPVLDTLRSPWHGTGPYEGGGADYPMYKALAYALSGIAGGTSQADGNGNQFDIALTAGPGSIAGLPVNLEQMFTHLMGIAERGRG